MTTAEVEPAKDNSCVECGVPLSDLGLPDETRLPDFEQFAALAADRAATGARIERMQAEIAAAKRHKHEPGRIEASAKLEHAQERIAELDRLLGGRASVEQGPCSTCGTRFVSGRVDRSWLDAAQRTCASKASELDTLEQEAHFVACARDYRLKEAEQAERRGDLTAAQALRDSAEHATSRMGDIERALASTRESLSPAPRRERRPGHRRPTMLSAERRSLSDASRP